MGERTRTRTLEPLTQANLALRHPAISLDQTRRCTRLFQRVRAGEGVDRGKRISDPGELRKRRGVDREEFCSRGLAREADVGERNRIAVAIAAGGGVFQVRFERSERSGGFRHRSKRRGIRNRSHPRPGRPEDRGEFGCNLI
jgi:hypothetical protein